ncbi:disease resistance protein RGA2-like isoform X2 [Typha angustifolia]|uniref:disease resistance protein RGA2-like isoform X2 n=1 Tax=Typha angustifolia TaxID=59011 RepID=UPI003C2BB995
MERKKGIELYYMPASAQKKKNRIQFQLYYDTLQFNYLCFKSFFSMVFICFLCFGVLRDLIVLEMALVMAGEHLVSVVVDGLVSKLGSGLWSELGLVWNFKNDLDDMKKTLISIQAVLNDAEKQSIKNESVRLWLKRLKAAAYDIEDMLDQFQFQTQNQSKDTKVLKYFSCSKSFFSMSLPIMGHKLKSMKERLQRIAEERSNYSLKEESITNPQEVIEGRTTFSAVNKDEVLGRGEEATEIINRLLSPSDAVSIISIVGIGGLGKTTLAKLIFNDGRIKGVFKPKIWVHAMDLKLEKLVDNVLSSLGTENSNILRNLEAKIKRAKEILDGKRYLIVLDDWWNDDPQKWNDFKQVLQDGKGDSKIIVTTRNERVSSIMSDEAPHKLKFLSDDVCSKLFQQRAFGSDGARDQNLVSIGEKIVEKCQGVPLTANALGGMLRFKSGEDAWKEVLHSELWELKKEEGGRQSENEIISSLKLSYQYMPSPLKLCFVYCSLYPKAFELDKDMLIQQWIAQRFIQKEHVGDYYVNYLLAISFLEETKEETYKMHDLVYDLATSIAGDEVSVLEAGKSPKINPEECRYASMIEYHQPSELQRDLPRKVRALHFQECRNLWEIPYSIGRLQKLHSLNLCGCINLKSLPESMGNHMELRILDIQRCGMLIESPKAIRDMTHLKIKSSEPLEFGPNTDIQLYLIDGPRDASHVVCNIAHAERTNLKERGGSIKSLTYRCWNGEGGDAKAMLEALQPHQNLQELFVRSYSGTMFPTWMWSQMELFLPNLVRIFLYRISNCELLPMLGQLPKLEKIDIMFMPKIRRISEEFCVARNTAGTSFSSLKTLGLCDMAELEEWVTAAAAGDGERGTSLFPCLEKLKISGCPKLRVRPGIPPSVETLNLGRSMLPLLTGLHVCDEMSLKHLTIKRVEDTISLPESIRHLLTSLESLEIDRCKSLATLPEWLGELCSLRSLEIKGCRLIDHLPESIQRLTALETLHIRQCSESLEKCTEKETGEDWDKISHIPNIRISTSYPWEL